MPGSEKKKARDRDRMQRKRADQFRLIDAVTTAYDQYEMALKNREHGGVAAHRMVDAIGFALSNYRNPMPSIPKPNNTPTT